MSWKPEVFVDGQWCANKLRFASKKEAEENARNLQYRWTAVSKVRATESDDPVNYSYIDMDLQPVKNPK